MICVRCGSQAYEGSMKEPYCRDCFQKYFNNNYKKFLEHIKELGL